MTVPYWVQDAVFYQIFPDRFANGDPTNDPPNAQPWGTPPTIWGFQGGDLRGVLQKLDYLLDLGVTALYFNPVFLSPSTHRYNTIDYYTIDPRLGDRKDLQAVLDAAHRNGMRVVLDGVFNHCSRGFFAFVDLLENQDHSGYGDWFHVRSFPVEAYSPGPAESYLAWWNFKSLPKFNTSNPAVRRFLLQVGRYWIEQGIDGWRLDVPNEIDDDDFWAEFRYQVKSANPDAYLVGEIWTADRRWVGPQTFDGLMNYPLREALLNLLGGAPGSAAAFAERVEALLAMYPRENVYAMYNLIGSHDVERARTLLDGDAGKVALAFTFLFAFPGAPAVYYGDEVGLKGGKDPECRGAFPWDESAWEPGLREHVRRLAALRRRLPVLRRGAYRGLLADDRRSLFAFARTLGEDSVAVVLNCSATPRSLRLPVGGLGFADGRILHNLLGAEEYIVQGDEAAISLPPWSGIWIG